MDKKKEMILTVITLFVFGYFIVRATYAYFQSRSNGSSNVDIKLTTYTTDLLTFETGDEINITADLDTFSQGKGNRSSSTFAKATLMANNMTNVATDNYYVYLYIIDNEFTYTTTGKPELVLQVTDNSGNPVTSIDGLTYVTTVDGSGTSISGFDVTEKSGLITLVNNKEINASPKTEEQYNISLILVNYDFDQNNNAGKDFIAKLMIQKDNLLFYYVISQYTGIQGENGLYYHDSTLANGAGDNSYRYAGSDPNNYVCFGSDESTCPDDNLYRIIGVFNDRVKLIKSDYATSNLLGKDGDYYAAYYDDTTNYKGSLSTSNISIYYWNYKGLSDHTGSNQLGSNTWSTSLLNKINLNTNYLNNIGSKWANMIDTTTWKVGGNKHLNIANSIPSVVYQNEIINPVTAYTSDGSIEYSAKVGLMYASDYTFAADSSAWTTTFANYDNSLIPSKNWMYMGLSEWTILRDATNNFSLFYLKLGFSRISASGSLAVRPVFFLSPFVKFLSGDGTKSSPFRIAD